MSRRHAELSKVGATVILRDLRSTNGVFVNGERIVDAPLRTGDIVRLGEWLGWVVALPENVDLETDDEEFAPGLLGGPFLRPVVNKAREAASSDLPVVLQGETGTGKELLAKAIHAWSGRSGAFVGVNCAALAPTMVAAELFGYRKGAFTGADRCSNGYFQAAQEGTLLLDEMTDLPLPVQGSLLRVLQEREVVPLGETRPIPVDVKILVATQTPLAVAVARGHFRADLMARLSGWIVELPPLRERRAEIPFIVSHKLRTRMVMNPVLSSALMEKLSTHAWPMNLRELDVVVSRLAAQAHKTNNLDVDSLPEIFDSAREESVEDAEGSKEGMIKTSRGERAFSTEAIDALTAAMKAHDGNIARAAAELGLSRSRAYRLLRASQKPRYQDGLACAD